MAKRSRDMIWPRDPHVALRIVRPVTEPTIGIVALRSCGRVPPDDCYRVDRVVSPRDTELKAVAHARVWG